LQANGGHIGESYAQKFLAHKLPATTSQAQNALANARAVTGQALAVQAASGEQSSFAQNQANCARFFCDLRRVLKVSQHQVAAEVVTHVETIQALEAGNVGMLPPWPETARVVMAYAALVNIDGRPVLSAIANMLHEYHEHRALIVPAPAVRLAARQPAHPQLQHVQVDRIRRAGTAIAHGAIRLPREAIKQVRKRPDRAFYAVSFPLGLMLLLLNSSMLPRPIVRLAESVKTYFQVHFAPVHDGLRWIDVDNPRSRRGDKLPVEHR
jgi:hypothetical protein